LAESANQLARHRPVECAAERQERHRHRFDRLPAADVLHGRLEALLCHLQLAGELRVEITPAVDLVEFRGTRLHRARGGGARPASVRAFRFEFPRLRLGAPALHANLFERPAMPFDPLLVDV
jgi:hypothetical protein